MTRGIAGSFTIAMPHYDSGVGGDENGGERLVALLDRFPRQSDVESQFSFVSMIQDPRHRGSTAFLG